MYDSEKNKRPDHDKEKKNILVDEGEIYITLLNGYALKYDTTDIAGDVAYSALEDKVYRLRDVSRHNIIEFEIKNGELVDFVFKRTDKEFFANNKKVDECRKSHNFLYYIEALHRKKDASVVGKINKSVFENIQVQKTSSQNSKPEWAIIFKIPKDDNLRIARGYFGENIFLEDGQYKIIKRSNVIYDLKARESVIAVGNCIIN